MMGLGPDSRWRKGARVGRHQAQGVRRVSFRRGGSRSLRRLAAPDWFGGGAGGAETDWG